jgi:hypothetical protein
MSMDLGVQQESILVADEMRKLRSALRTEQEMHNAWRKRAEEAEAELFALKATVASGSGGT